MTASGPQVDHVRASAGRVAAAVPWPTRIHFPSGTTASLLARGACRSEWRSGAGETRILGPNIYTRVDLSDLQAGIDLMGILSAVR